ncbi:hypothetical protein SS50377_20165 [Spironucleus salmonicida]|uniref:Uncharacterized protein n=1 Tax=Spironucleus salmonicida TaxID=348837 RepID=V6LKR8_9EUKA|nr:hypothetical protein SS50377_20165 [Spironucleus salmonicida]|eukprot:EST45220.1 Hypothetical protein SS50377_14795 [Spironucleus salmonicida]
MILQSRCSFQAYFNAQLYNKYITSIYLIIVNNTNNISQIAVNINSFPLFLMQDKLKSLRFYQLQQLISFPTLLTTHISQVGDKFVEFGMLSKTQQSQVQDLVIYLQRHNFELKMSKFSQTSSHLSIINPVVIQNQQYFKSQFLTKTHLAPYTKQKTIPVLSSLSDIPTFIQSETILVIFNNQLTQLTELAPFVDEDLQKKLIDLALKLQLKLPLLARNLHRQDEVFRLQGGLEFELNLAQGQNSDLDDFVKVFVQVVNACQKVKLSRSAIEKIKQLMLLSQNIITRADRTMFHKGDLYISEDSAIDGLLEIVSQ